MIFWEIEDKVLSLKRAKKHDEALSLLYKSMRFEAQLGRINTRAFEQSAIIYRKQKDSKREIAILETFLSFSSANISGYDRLKTRYEKLCAKNAYEIPQEPFQKQVLVIDVETTGFSKRDELIEFGAVLFKYNQFTDELTPLIDSYSGLRATKASMSSGAQKRHRIAKNELKGEKLDEVKIKSLIQRADFIVAHNASFDKRFTVPLFPSADQKAWYCSMNGVNWKARGFERKALQYILKYYKIKVARAHRALDDAQAVYELLGKTDPLSEKTVLSQALYSPLKGEYPEDNDFPLELSRALDDVQSGQMLLNLNPETTPVHQSARKPEKKVEPIPPAPKPPEPKKPKKKMTKKAKMIIGGAIIMLCLSCVCLLALPELFPIS